MTEKRKKVVYRCRTRGGADSLGENMENNREIIERKRKDIKRKEQREDSEGTCTMKGQGH